MPADEAKLSATRSRPSTNFNPAPIPQDKPTSPWVPFMISFVLIASATGGLFFYMDMQFKNLEANLQSSLHKTNDFVLAMDQRLKKIEGDIAASDAEADQAGSSLTSKMLNLESRVSAAEKNIGWNSSRVAKQVSDIESIQSKVDQAASSVNAQAGKVAANTAKIDELINNDTSKSVATLSQKVETNAQAIETIDAHRTRLSDAIQKVQSDTARLIRLYEKDNPTAKRVQ